MTFETAARCVDLALQSTAPALTFEIGGGEPLLHWPLVEHLIEYAIERNSLSRKPLRFVLVSNLSLMDDLRLAYLLDRGVQVCTSLDGPAFVHDGARVWRGGRSHAKAAGWIRRLNDSYVDRGLDRFGLRVEAVATVTRLSLGHARELVDEYVDLGCRSVWFRQLEPYGYARVTMARLGYPMEDFLEFYRAALDRIVEVNRAGVDFLERTAAVLLTRILGRGEPGFLDLRSPCGGGIGQIVYDHDGRLFTCDEGRVVDRAGDPCFQIGEATDRYRKVVNHPMVKAMVHASTLDAQPGCHACAYKPWCGACPVHNYCEQGTIHGTMPESSWCERHRGILDLLMTRLHRADPFELELFRRWSRPLDGPGLMRASTA